VKGLLLFGLPPAPDPVDDLPGEAALRDTVRHARDAYEPDPSHDPADLIRFAPKGVRIA
jgi:hypothetical protein